MTRNRIDLECQNCGIRNDSVFGGLCAHTVSTINGYKSTNVYRKGQILFHEGTRPLGVYCINKGKIKLYKLGNEGKEQIIQLAKQGDILGYRAMISEEVYPVSAETLEESQVCFIPKQDFLQMIADNHELYARLFKHACHELGLMAQNVTNLAQKTVRERLAITLIMLKETYGVDPGEEDKVVINLTREDLANIVGTATETLIRLLHDFKEDLIITTKGRKIILENERELIRIANLY
jgi:CRP/FNR family transcriptional regulator